MEPVAVLQTPRQARFEDFMAVIALSLDEENGFLADIEIEDDGIQLDEGLETAIILSFFSDQRCTTEELPDGEISQRGWWGDMYAETDGDQFGSKLWLFDREKQTLENLSKIEDTAKVALQWMIDDGIAKSIAIQASYPRSEFLLLEVSLTKPDGTIYAFKTLWDGQRIKRA